MPLESLLRGIKATLRHSIAPYVLAFSACAGSDTSAVNGNQDAHLDAGRDVVVCIDNDQDGYSANCGKEVDCDDSKAEVNVLAVEYCDNLDNDCDGIIDNPRQPVSGSFIAYEDCDRDCSGNRDKPAYFCSGEAAGPKKCPYVSTRSDPDDIDNSVTGSVDPDCFYTDDGGVKDMGIDALRYVVDAGYGAGVDAGLDAPPDAGVDVGADVEIDVAVRYDAVVPDVGMDVGEDGGGCVERDGGLSGILDDFNRADGALGENFLSNVWSTAGETWSILDSEAYISWNSSGAHPVASSEIGYRETFDTTVKFRVDSSGQGGAGIFLFAVNSNRDVYVDGLVANIGMNNLETHGVRRGTTTIEQATQLISNGVDYLMRFAYDGNNLKLKLWEDGTPEPVDFLIDVATANVDPSKTYMTLMSDLDGGESASVFVDYILDNGGCF